jgi:hypothetical protein
MFKFTGTIKVIQDTQKISDKFQKREFVVTDTTSMYPQDIMFQALVMMASASASKYIFPS